MKNYTKEELLIYWVGLMEGDGSIQVNHWKKKYLAYRMVIKLKNTVANKTMLEEIQKAVGGTVRESTDTSEVIWVENSKDKIKELISIFEKYPPLTTRKQLQLKYVQECMEHNSVEKYLETRDLRYEAAKKISETLLKEVEAGTYVQPKYWRIWLVGFIEAGGCFSFRKQERTGGFSISQNMDRYLIEYIRKELKIAAKVREMTPNLWIVETQAKGTFREIVKRFQETPLIGEKGVQMKELLKKLDSNSN